MRIGLAGAAPAVHASLPKDTRIYAIGDIHGRADLLADIIHRIDEDIRRRPIRFPIEVYLGDYIDRGPDSKGVIDQLAVRVVRHQAVCLRGNHEHLLEAFLQDPDAIRHWIRVGATPTLASYGVALQPDVDISILELQKTFLATFPRTHELFLQCLHNSFGCGDYLFVHAGIRPGVPLDRQDPEDLFWIRDEFLESTSKHGKIVVHGHTPVVCPDIRSNRINIDTGAWRSGVLTCIAIEASEVLVL